MLEFFLKKIIWLEKFKLSWENHQVMYIQMQPNNGPHGLCEAIKDRRSMQEKTNKNLLLLFKILIGQKILLTYFRKSCPQGIFYLKLFEKKLIFSKTYMSKKPVTSVEAFSGIVDLYKLLNKQINSRVQRGASMGEMSFICTMQYNIY